MEILVLAADGLVGSNVVQSALERGWNVAGTCRSERPGFDIEFYDLDIRDSNRFGNLLDLLVPDAVVNCAAMTNVDGCESNEEEAFAINSDAPGELAARCSKRGVRFLHLSTDYVFDGRASSRYEEKDHPNPLQAYGESKLLGDQAVRKRHSSSLIARLSFVYGLHGATGSLAGFPAWLRESIEEREQVPLFTDQYTTPSMARSTSETLLDLLVRDATGLFNVACRSCVTPYEFGKHIVDAFDLPTGFLVKESLSDVNRPAERPTYTCLSVEKVEAFLDANQPTIKQDLAGLQPSFPS